MNILIFGGTIEGRKLTEYLSQSDAQVHVCVATDYGKELLHEGENITVHAGRLDEEEMKKLVSEISPELIIDATHPYAVNVSKNIILVAKECGIEYIRVVRDEDEVSEDEDIILTDNVEEAIDYLEDKEGRIFLTTGSNELAAFTRLTNFQDRLIIRVLSSPEVLQKCKDLGFSGKYTIAAQGPFSEDINYAMFKEHSAKWLVTKNTGNSGGFAAKLNAAKRGGMKTVIIGRPEETAENTMTLNTLIQILPPPLVGGVTKGSTLPPPSVGGVTKDSTLPPPLGGGVTAGDGGGYPRPRTVSLIGIGPGSKDLMTVEAHKAIEESDLIIGAERMIREFKDGKASYCAYRKDEIAKYIEDYPEYGKVAILLSGDIGFYSGAKGLIEVLSEKDLKIKCIPGISSPIYLMDRLGVSWDDAVFASIHGLDVDILELIKNNKKVCTIVGKTDDVSKICSELVKCSLGSVRVSVGSNLSYPEETIEQGTAEDFSEREFPGLSVVLFERE